MDDFLLSPELVEWRRSVRDFVEKSITVDYIRECDINREYPLDAYKKVAEQGWLEMLIPTEYGGVPFDIFAFVIMLQELGRHSVDFGSAFAIPAFTVMNIVHHGTPKQQDTYLRAFAEGTVRFSISITEPEAGSDVANVSTRATRDGEHFIVNGVKMYSSAAHAENNVICLLARTDTSKSRHEGLSLILVPKDLHGISMSRLPTVARRATGTNQVFFEDVRVPAENLLGEEGEGWRLITEHLEFERLTMAAIYGANAQQAVDTAVKYAKERIQFGRSISSFQVIKHGLAQMQTDVTAANMMVFRAATRIAAGLPAIQDVSMAKLLASETLYRVAGEGMQILGGAAQLPETDMERYWREGKQSMIGGGSSQIQRSIIAKTMGL